MNGIAVQNVIGKDTGGERLGTQEIIWDGNRLPVMDNEVLTAAEALEIFTAYYKKRSIPGAFVMRPR